MRVMEVLRNFDGRHTFKLVRTYTQGPFLDLLLWPIAACDLRVYFEDVDNLLYRSSDEGSDDEL
jgi:hypothetical protein